MSRPLGSDRPRGRMARVGGRVAALLSSGRGVALLLLLAIVYARLAEPILLTDLRFQAFDMFQQAEPREASGDHVAIVDIDEASIAALGQWPWSRDRMAELVRQLDAAGALVIGFDVVFSEPDRLSPPAFAQSAGGVPPMVRGLLAGLPDTDAAFASVVDAAPVVLGMSWLTASSQAAASGGAAHPNRDPLTPKAAVVGYRGDVRPFLFGAHDALRNIPALEQSADGVGLFSLAPEHDSVVRRVPAALRIGDVEMPSLSLEMMRVALGASHIGLVRDPAGVGVEHVRVGDYTAPTDRQGRVWLHYAEHDPGLYIPAADVISGAFEPAAVAGKFVLVGTSAVGLRDIRTTALGEAVPGVEVHAQLIDVMLGGEHLQRPPYALGFEHVATVFGGLLLIIVAPMLSAARSLPIFAALLVGVWATAYWAFHAHGLAFDPTYPSLALILVYGALAYGAYSRAEAQKRQIRSAFSHYLSPAMVEQLADNPDSLQLGGESREMTFLFCDIAGFTAFVEQADPSDLVRLLNEYLDGVCSIVMRHGGTIDKIVGDAVHAMFNAPLDDADHAANAVRAALEIEAFVNDFRARKHAEGFDFGSTRIGVNTGRVVIGNFGGSSRFDYTAHGDAINTAARLEGLNKHLGTTICVSGATATLCPELPFRPIGRIFLKGKDASTETFAPVRPSEFESALPERYADAFDQLGAEAPTAAAAFDALAEEFPNDPLIALHRRRLGDGAAGVEIRMQEK